MCLFPLQGILFTSVFKVPSPRGRYMGQEGKGTVLSSCSNWG